MQAGLPIRYAARTGLRFFSAFFYHRWPLSFIAHWDERHAETLCAKVNFTDDYIGALTRLHA